MPYASSLYLDKPRTEKELDSGKSFGFASMQGWRSSHEDAHKHLIPLDDHLWKYWSYFTIFDGHNGIEIAKNAAHYLHKHLIDALNEMVKEHDEPVRSSQLDLDQLHKVIKNTFMQLDDNLRQIVKDDSGAVCIATLIGPEKIYLINVGDSRAIIVSKDGHVLAATKDHKPNVRQEQERIRQAGGHITKRAHDVPRVESNLAMTRVFGDFSLNKNIVPALADIVQYPRDASTAFVVIACDGIWDVMSNEQVAAFVAQHAPTTSLENIASQLLDRCLHEESSDNMTVYIVQLY